MFTNSNRKGVNAGFTCSEWLVESPAKTCNYGRFPLYITGLLSDFCYAFSDDDLVSDESFFSWEKNSKSGIAVKSVSNFFKWLREDNDNTQ